MSNPATQLVRAVRELVPRLESRALEIERTRRIPADLVTELRSMGVFRMLVPRRYGGQELDAPSVIEILTELAVADAATAWTVMIGCHAPLIFATLSRDAFETIYENGPDVIGAGSSSPRGVTETAGEGFRASGQWSLASGCQHADWLFGVCIDNDRQSDPASGSQRLRYVVLPASQWQILDTWSATGLRGTGSHDIGLLNAYVTGAYTALFGKNGAPIQECFTEPIFVAPHLQKCLHVASIAVGIAEGALNDAVAIARTGKRRVYMNQTLAETGLFQHRIGRADADVRAARAYLRERAQEYWRQASRGSVDTSLDLQVLQAVTWIAETCANAIESCFRASGAVAVYETSPLQRRLRDVHTLLQHILVQEGVFTGAGALKVGQPAMVPFVRT
jgi:alkylation response protein AidB-like acyl-CoA dehydrogenase